MPESFNFNNLDRRDFMKAGGALSLSTFFKFSEAAPNACCP